MHLDPKGTTSDRYSQPLVILFVLLTLVSPAHVANAALPKAASESSKTYVHEASGFSMDYPLGWFRKDSTPRFVILTSFDPSTSRHNQFFGKGEIKIDIDIEPVGQGPATLGEWLQQLNDQPSESGYRILSERQFVLDGGAPAYMRQARSNMGPMIFLLAIVNGHRVLVAAYGDADSSKEVSAILSTCRSTTAAGIPAEISIESKQTDSVLGCGNKIAFVDPTDWQVWTMNADGTQRTRLTNFPERQTPFHLQWFPDGQRLVFTTFTNPISTYTVNADGTGLTLLPYAYETPVVSPDGTRLAGRVQVMKPASNGGLTFGTDNLMVSYLKTQTTINVTGCTVEKPCMASSPSWSPDGTRLAYVGKSPQDKFPGIVILDASRVGSALRVPVPGFFMGISWSPDGAWLAAYRFGTQGGEAPTLVLVRQDGSETKTLAKATTGFSAPTWSPDSRYLAYNNDSFINIISVTGDGATQLGRGQNPAWQPCAQISRPTLPTTQLIDRKKDAISFLEHPSLDVLGLAPVSLRSYDESAARSLMDRLTTDQTRYERGEMTADQAQAHQRSVDAFSRFTLAEESLVQLYPMVRDSNSDLLDKNVDIIFASASFATLIHSGLQRATALVVGDRIADALMQKTTMVLTDLVNSLWEMIELGMTDEEYKLVSRNVRENLYKAILAQLATSGAEIGWVKVLETFAGDPMKAGGLALYMQSFIDHSQPFLERGAMRVEKAPDEAWFADNVQGTYDEAAAQVQTIVETARVETEKAHRNYQSYKENSTVAGIVGKSGELAQLASSSSSDAGWFSMVISTLDDLFKMSRSYYEIVAGDDIGEHCDRLLRFTADAQLHAWDPSAPRVTFEHTNYSHSSARTSGANQYPISYSTDATRVEARLSSQLAFLLDTSSELDALLAQVPESVASEDRERTLALLDALLAIDEQYAVQLRIARAAALPAERIAATDDDVNRLSAIADAESLYSLSALRLYWQLAASTTDSADTANTQEISTLTDETRAALSETRTLASESLRVAAAADTPRRLAISSVAVSPNITADSNFAVDASLHNPGSAAQDAVEIRVVGSHLSGAESVFRIENLAGGAEQRVQLNLHAGEPGQALLTLEAWADNVLHSTYMTELTIRDPQNAEATGSTAVQPASELPTSEPTEETTPSRRSFPCLSSIVIPMLLLALALFVNRRTL